MFRVQSMVLVTFSCSTYSQMHFVMFFGQGPRFTSIYIYVAVGNVDIRIIRNSILLFVAFPSFSVEISIFACHFQPPFEIL